MNDFRPQRSRSCWRQKDSLVEHLTIMIQRTELKFSMARQSVYYPVLFVCCDQTLEMMKKIKSNVIVLGCSFFYQFKQVIFFLRILSSFTYVG